LFSNVVETQDVGEEKKEKPQYFAFLQGKGRNMDTPGKTGGDFTHG
jgi:hypothetical protein